MCTTEDDPVDSQDTIFLFRTAGLLKKHLRDVGQLLVFSHNFEFFNQTRDWLSGREMKESSQMYLISSHRENGTNAVIVEDLPGLLAKHKTEYQYLFGRLLQFATTGVGLDEPLVANVARKILEYFAGFKWSCKTTEEFANIVLNRFVNSNEERKKGVGDCVVKFLQEYSHGQDFGRPITAAMLEGKTIAEEVLKFIELADKEHYDEAAALSAV